MFYQRKDLSLYYECHGEGDQAIVILPGWGDTRLTFLSMIRDLSPYFKIYIIDYPGFGNSTFPNHNLTIYDYTLLIKEWMEEEQIEKPILIGHSFGGRIIITLLGYYHIPNERAILIDAAGILPKKTWRAKWRTIRYRFLKKISRLLPIKKQKKYQEWLIQKFGSTDYKALPSNMRQTFSLVVQEDLTTYLNDIQSEVLLLWGELDCDTPLSDGEIMARRIPNSTLIPLANLDHYSYFRNPYLVNSIILHFLLNKKSL